MGPDPQCQQQLVEAGGMQVLVATATVAVSRGYWRLLAGVVRMLAVAVTGYPAAQDEVCPLFGRGRPTCFSDH